MDSSPLSSGLLPFSFLFLFCFVYRTNTCMSYRINQLDKIWKVVVLLLYFFFCYLVNIKKKFGNFACFFACFIYWQGKHELPTLESLFGGIVLFYSSQNRPPSPQFELLLLPTPFPVSPYWYLDLVQEKALCT